MSIMFLDIAPKVPPMREIINKLEFKKRAVSRDREDGENMSAKNIPDKELLSKMYKRILKLNNKKTNDSIKK